MSEKQSVSRRGYYYDLNASPYEFKTPYGEIFKFPSEKKLEIYRRELTKELNRVKKFLERRDLENYLCKETIKEIYTAVYLCVYTGD